MAPACQGAWASGRSSGARGAGPPGQENLGPPGSAGHLGPPRWSWPTGARRGASPGAMGTSACRGADRLVHRGKCDLGPPGHGELGPVMYNSAWDAFFCSLPYLLLSICFFLALFPLYPSILLLFSQSVFTDSSSKCPTPGYLGLHPQQSRLTKYVFRPFLDPLYLGNTVPLSVFGPPLPYDEPTRG